eukprot:861507-Prorocentrum_lima.AAC.1
MGAFAAAGWRMEALSTEFDELEVKYRNAMNDASPQNMRDHELAEEDLLRHTEYKACQDYGRMQTEYLKALDFMDILTDKI